MSDRAGFLLCDHAVDLQAQVDKEGKDPWLRIAVLFGRAKPAKHTCKTR